ncbi:hypothetical protein LAZ67_5001412 [Cordylochernes scorpioides]|uniref:Transposase n=1 Tax=Cordylochernes scorpioides TaxID=51811 RepID=A0ABY6KFM0_9ARAC|nr:hypothetical protein LAZ67_5001412 [Cordylochernes scorpioides]
MGTLHHTGDKGAIQAVETHFFAETSKFKQTLSAGKLIATLFLGRKGLLLCDFMRRGKTINSDRYCETLKQLRRAIQNKKRGMLTKGVRFHHDNARPHTAHQTTALIEEFGWELVSHPPYSPDVAPSDFHLFPELKKNLGGTQFQDDDELEEAVLGFLRGQAAEFFDSGFHKWVSRMQKCVERNGECFLVEDYIYKHGAPREMITDHGINFIYQVKKRSMFCVQIDIELHWPTLLRPTI